MNLPTLSTTYEFDKPVSCSKIGRSASLRLASRQNFAKPKSCDFDFQPPCSLDHLLSKALEDSWVFDRPSLYERRKKISQSNQSLRFRWFSNNNCHAGISDIAVHNGTKLTLSSSSASATTITSSSSSPSSSLSAAATTLILFPSGLTKPLVPPKPKINLATSLIYKSSSSASSSSSSPLSSSSIAATSSSSSSSLLENLNPVEKNNPGIESTLDKTSSSSSSPSSTKRTELPPKYKTFLSKRSQIFSSKRLPQPKRLSILREFNDDDNDNVGADGDDNDDNLNEIKKISHNIYKKSKKQIYNKEDNGSDDDDDDDDDLKQIQVERLQALEWIQEELQGLKVKDRVLFRTFLQIGSNIQGFLTHDYSCSLNDSHQYSFVDLSACSITTSNMNEVNDSAVFL